jgi:hypothetical protein
MYPEHTVMVLEKMVSKYQCGSKYFINTFKGKKYKLLGQKLRKKPGFRSGPCSIQFYHLPSHWVLKMQLQHCDQNKLQCNATIMPH